MDKISITGVKLFDTVSIKGVFGILISNKLIDRDSVPDSLYMYDGLADGQDGELMEITTVSGCYDDEDLYTVITIDKLEMEIGEYLPFGPDDVEYLDDAVEDIDPIDLLLSVRAGIEAGKSYVVPSSSGRFVQLFDRTVYMYRAVFTFSGKVGVIGGLIESADNIAQSSGVSLSHLSVVGGTSRISGNVHITGSKIIDSTIQTHGYNCSIYIANIDMVGCELTIRDGESYIISYPTEPNSQLVECNITGNVRICLKNKVELRYVDVDNIGCFAATRTIRGLKDDHVYIESIKDPTAVCISVGASPSITACAYKLKSGKVVICMNHMDPLTVTEFAEYIKCIKDNDLYKDDCNRILTMVLTYFHLT